MYTGSGLLAKFVPKKLKFILISHVFMTLFPENFDFWQQIVKVVGLKVNYQKTPEAKMEKIIGIFMG